MQASHPSAPHTTEAAVLPAWCGMDPSIAQLLQDGRVGTTYTVNGWLRSCRSSKNVWFLTLADGSCTALLQAVVSPALVEQALSPEPPATTPRQLSTGASVRLQGQLVATPGRQQSVELQVSSLTLLGEAAVQAYPLQKKGHSLEFLRSVAHLRPRSNTFGAVFRVRHALASATHTFFNSHGYTLVQTPIITASDCEGAGEMFEVQSRQKGDEFFGRRAWLTVSGQLNGEALAYGLGRIYTFGPTFRAENSNTVRHLCEFWMIEPETAFCNLQQNQAIAEAYLRQTLTHVLQACATEITFLTDTYEPSLRDTLEQCLSQPFGHITYSEAVAQLAQAKQDFSVPPSWGMDLQTEHERYLVETLFARPLIVTDYPRQRKAFYMYQNDDEKTVAAMDVLLPRLGEIIGGSQREHRLERLQARLAEMHMSAENYAWYLDLQRFGAVPHAGFGLGFERLVMFCTGMSNIRDVIAFPRAPGLVSY